MSEKKKENKISLILLLSFEVNPLGFEPRTPSLKVMCSTS